MNAATKLPDNLPDLIELAVRDAIKCEKDPRYVLDMEQWFKPVDGRCAVCFAGAVMAQTLGAKSYGELSPDDFGDDSEKLEALEDVRQGIIDPFWLSDELGAGITDECADEVNALIRRAFFPSLQRAPWKTYLEAARILREGARVEAQEVRNG